MNHNLKFSSSSDRAFQFLTSTIPATVINPLEFITTQISSKDDVRRAHVVPNPRWSVLIFDNNFVC